MRPQHHRVPRQLFDAVAAGGGGASGVRELAMMQYSKHVLLLYGVLTAAEKAGRNAWMARQGYDLLAAVQRHDPPAAEAVIRYPAVGAWALCTLGALRGDQNGSAAQPGRLSAVAAAAAIRAGLPAEIELPVTPGSDTGQHGGTIELPSLGAASVRGATATLRIADGRAVVVSEGDVVEVPADPYQNAPGWRGLHCVQAGALSVLIDDLDPFRMPALSNVAPRMSAAQASREEETLRQAWSLLERHHPASAAEVAQTVAVVVPLIAAGAELASSSSPAAFGAVAMSEPPDPCACAMTLIHETAHLKLSALSDVVSLTLPDDGRRFYAPWRPDPRPAGGLLQGVYAHLAVAGFWRTQRRICDGVDALRAHADFARWRDAAARTSATLLSSGELTAAGQDFIRGMTRTLSTWQAEDVPAEALALARHEAQQHLERWQHDNGPLPSWCPV